jgi:hypothetical protein
MAAPGLRHLPMLAALVVALGPTAGAQPRHSRHHHHHLQDVYGGERQSQPGGAGQPSVAPPQASGITGGVAETIRACADQATELQKIPFDAVLKTVRPSDDQRTALDQIRSAAADAVNKLHASCPKDVPARLTDGLDTMRASLDAIKAALLPLRPAFVAAYATLTDEQKARLVVLAISRQVQPAAATGESNPGADNQAQPAGLDCRQWPAMLKSWPLNRIEGELELSDQQHAAFYTLMAAIYREAAGLATSCNDEDALTPVVRLDDELGRIDALRRCVDTIAPALADFVNALNDEQKAQLSAMLGVSPQSQPQTTAR